MELQFVSLKSAWNNTEVHINPNNISVIKTDVSEARSHTKVFVGEKSFDVKETPQEIFNKIQNNK